MIRFGYQRKVFLSAILCFHRITDNRVLLWTPSSLSRIDLVTIMWDAVDDEVGYERLAELQVDHWKAMITQGSTMFRYLNTPESASTFLMDLIMKIVTSPVLPLEQVSDLRELCGRAARRELYICSPWNSWRINGCTDFTTRQHNNVQKE